jgi:hypothetical protein
LLLIDAFPAATSLSEVSVTMVDSWLGGNIKRKYSTQENNLLLSLPSPSDSPMTVQILQSASLQDTSTYINKGCLGVLPSFCELFLQLEWPKQEWDDQLEGLVAELVEELVVEPEGPQKVGFWQLRHF